MSTPSVTETPIAGQRLGHWQLSLIAFGMATVVLFAAYWPTFISMAEIWWRSDTFAHGFLIFPISLYLIWRRRRPLATRVPEADWRGLVVLAILGMGWIAANVVDVQVIQQLCFIAMIVALVWSLLGWQVVREIAFPLGFLFFAVPMGEFLIPPMMNFTADFTVKMIELSGIPVYREGTFFSIPSGDWSVVEGCSGLRYLIASITVGCLYAYLTYRSLWRRLAFIALSIGFPIIANGLRAYMIVMIAHFSDMKLALGVDHYIYGWVFFGLVMMLMFWLGSFWRDETVPDQAEEEVPLFSFPSPDSAAFRQLISVTLVAWLILAIWPVWAAYVRDRASARDTMVDLSLPDQVGTWHKSETALTSWEPHYLYPDARAKAVYTNGGRQVALFVLYYCTQTQGKELINSQNILIPQKHPVWKMPWEKKVKVTLNPATLTLKEGILQSSFQHLLVWRWNWVSGTFTVNDHLAKILEAKDKLLGTPRDAAGIVVTTEYEDDPKAVKGTLRDFTRSLLPVIENALTALDRGR